MKYPFTFSVCIALVVASGVWAGPALQVPAVTYGFGGGNCGISDAPEISFHGNKMHMKMFNRSWMVSEDSRLTGPVEVDVEISIHNNGHIGGHGSFVLESSDGAGTWEADFNIHVPGGKTIDVDGMLIVKDSQMNARGTGAFEGQWFFFSHGLAEAPWTIPVEGPDGFGCEFAGEIWSGTILDPNTP